MSAVIENTASLYILIFSKRGLLKIGKANNVHVRCKALKQTWGEVDYAESYELAAPQSTVFRLEKSLHFLLSAHGAGVTEGDGYTEMFALTSLDFVLKHIELFMASGSAPISLKKGIDAPQDSRAKRVIENDLSQAGTGAIAYIGVMAWAIYCVIKAEARPAQRHSNPTIPRIGEIVGTSNDTIRLALTKLEDAGMLSIEKKGRRNFYSWP